jgi:hypothetical protein
MQLNISLWKWSRTAGHFLVAGALAWTMKLSVIVCTNGRIIDTGASAFFMKIGLVMFIIGSTGIGSRLSHNRHLLLRAISIIVSPALVFGSFFLFGMITNPIFRGSGIWYAQQEAPIGLAVLVYIFVGYYLNRSPVTISR